MGNFEFIENHTDIQGLKIIKPKKHEDERGYFMETWNYTELMEKGLNVKFVQDNESFSQKGVLRGLHFQKNRPQGKLVRVIDGEVFDVAVDLRRDSKTFGKSFGIILTHKNNLQFYIPEGFAHGFLVLSEYARFLYKCTDFYSPKDEGGLIWNDPKLGIQWPLENIDNIHLSEKDKHHPTFDKLNFSFNLL